MSSRQFIRLCGLGLLFGASASSAPASAAWSAFTAMGSAPLVGNPSCARYAEGVAVCAGVGSGGTMLFDLYSGGSWHGWAPETGGNTLASDPSCSGPGVEDVKNEYVICAARTATGGVAVDRYENGSFASELVVGASGAFGSAPSCAPLASRSEALGVACSARTASSQLISAVYHNASAWSALSNWTLVSLNTGSGATALPVLSAPGCAPDNLGDVICAWLSAANGVATVAATQLQPSPSHHGGVVWSAIASLGGDGTNPPSCTDAGAVGQVGCFSTGTNSALYGDEFAGGAFAAPRWGGWGGFEGLVQSYSCADYGLHGGTTSYACGVVGLINSGFWTNTLAHIGVPWSGWVLQGKSTSFIGNPSCFALRRNVTPGRVMCVVPQANGTTVSIIGP